MDEGWFKGSRRARIRNGIRVRVAVRVRVKPVGNVYCTGCCVRLVEIAGPKVFTTSRVLVLEESKLAETRLPEGSDGA